MSLGVMVCVKRVPDSSGEVVLTEDGQEVDGRFSGYTTGPHEACAVETAARLREAAGDGEVTVFTLGRAEAVEQVRQALSVGGTAGVHVEADPSAYGPADIAAEIAATVRDHEAAGRAYDLVLLGNDAADTGDFQVPIRVAYALGRPVVTNVKEVSLDGEVLVATGDAPDGGTERYELPRGSVVAMLEGGVEPRYPSIKGRMAAKKVEIETRQPSVQPTGSGRMTLRVPPPVASNVVSLGEGPAAASAVVEKLAEMGVLR